MPFPLLCYYPFSCEYFQLLKIIACRPVIMLYGLWLTLAEVCFFFSFAVNCKALNINFFSPFVDWFSKCCYITCNDCFSILQIPDIKPTVVLLKKRIQIDYYLEMILYECVREGEKVVIVSTINYKRVAIRIISSLSVCTRCPPLTTSVQLSTARLGSV